MAKRSMTTEAYLDEMTCIRYSSHDGMFWAPSPRMDLGFAVQVFMAIKRILVYKRLRNEEFIDKADGRQIQKMMAPNWNSFAFYWLRQDGVQRAFDYLIQAKLITKSTKQKPPYGYGCDELYGFTDMSLALLRSLDDLQAIRGAVRNIIEDQLTRKTKIKDVDAEDSDI